MRQSVVGIRSLGAIAALSALASAGASMGQQQYVYDVTPAKSGPITMDELRGSGLIKAKKLRGRRRRSWRGGGKARLPWYKGSRWAKRATQRGGNPAKASR